MFDIHLRVTRFEIRRQYMNTDHPEASMVTGEWKDVAYVELQGEAGTLSLQTDDSAQMAALKGRIGDTIRLTLHTTGPEGL